MIAADIGEQAARVGGLEAALAELDILQAADGSHRSQRSSMLLRVSSNLELGALRHMRQQIARAGVVDRNRPIGQCRVETEDAL